MADYHVVGKHTARIESVAKLWSCCLLPLPTHGKSRGQCDGNSVNWPNRNRPHTFREQEFPRRARLRTFLEYDDPAGVAIVVLAIPEPHRRQSGKPAPRVLVEVLPHGIAETQVVNRPFQLRQLPQVLFCIQYKSA